MKQAKQIFEVLMLENADMLLAFLRASIRDKHVAEDILQETMVMADCSCRRCRRIARNQSLNVDLSDEDTGN